MKRPRLLDLFAGEGGAGTGYHRAGFDVFGVDSNPAALARYPFPSYCGDALDYLEEFGARFDAIHASPPCQARTTNGAAAFTAGSRTMTATGIGRGAIASCAQ